MKNTIKLISSLALALFIFSANTQPANAYWGVWDFNIQDIPNFLKNAITASSQVATEVSTVADTGLHYKDVFTREVLDRIAAQTAKMALQRITGSMVDWINSGFNGKPMFISDPERFFGNIAQNSLLTEVNRLMDSDGAANIMLAYGAIDYIVNKQSGANLRSALTPTIYNSIQNRICNPENQQRFGEQLRRVGVSDIGATYCSGGAGGGYGDSYVVNDLFGKSFQAGGGWDSFLEITQNQARNTAQGRFMAAISQAEAAAAAREAELRAQQQASGGFIDSAACAEYETAADGSTLTSAGLDEGEPICKTYVSQSPGIQAQQSLNAVVTNPVQQQQNIKTFNDALNAIGEAFVSRLIEFGVGQVAGLVDRNSGSGFNMDSYIARINSNLASSSENDAVRLGNAPLTQDQQNTNNQNAESFKATIVPRMERQIDDMNEVIAILEEERDWFQRIWDAYYYPRMEQGQCPVDPGATIMYNKLYTTPYSDNGQNIVGFGAKLRSVTDEIANMTATIGIIQGHLNDINAAGSNYVLINSIYTSYMALQFPSLAEYQARQAQNRYFTFDYANNTPPTNENQASNISDNSVFGRIRTEIQEYIPYLLAGPCQGVTPPTNPDGPILP